MKQEVDIWKIDAIEPHCIVNSRRRFDNMEETIFTLAWGELYSSMTKNYDIFTEDLREMCPNLQFTDKNEPYLYFYPSKFSKMGFDYIFKKFMSLQTNPITIYNKENKPILSFPLFSVVKREKGRIKCFLSDTAIRHLLYFGIGEGGCFFNTAASLEMGTAIWQRLYRYLKSYQNNDDIPVLTFERLRERFNVNYDVDRFTRRILKPLIQKLKENPYCDITATYELEKEIYGKGRPRIIGVKFYVQKKQNKKRRIKAHTEIA